MNAGVTWLNGTAVVWAEAMLRASWQGGVALAAVWLACRLMPRLNPRVQCWLWRLAFLKLVQGLLWWQPVELPLLPPTSGPVVAAGMRPRVDLQARAVGPRSSTGSSPSAGEEVLQERRFEWPSARGWLLIAWSCGVGWWGVILVSEWRRSRRWRRIATPETDEDCLACLHELSGRFRLARRVPLLRTNTSGSPMLAGIVRPAVLLPRAVLRANTPDETRWMLAHELGHLKRRDLWWNWLPTLAQGIFFFHPMVWLAVRGWRLSQEMACDELALRHGGAAPAEYANALLNVVTRCSRRADGGLATVAVVESYTTLRRRLIAMKSRKPFSRKRLVLSAAVVTVLGIAVLIPWRVVAQVAEDRALEHPDGVGSVAFTPDGIRVVTGSKDGEIRVWDRRSGQLQRALPAHAGEEWLVLAVSPDGKTAASGSQKNLKLWSTSDWALQRTVPMDAQLGILSLAFSPDGTRVAAACGDAGVRVWEAKTGFLQQTLGPVRSEPGFGPPQSWDVRFAPDGKTLLAGTLRMEGERLIAAIRVWDAATGEEKRSLSATVMPTSWAAMPMSIAVSPDNQTIAAGYILAGGGTAKPEREDGRIRLWNAKTGLVEQTFSQGETGAGVEFSPDGKVLASFGPFPDDRVNLWDVSSGKRVHTFRNATFPIAFSPDGKTLALRNHDDAKVLRLIDFRAAIESPQGTK